MKYLQLLFLSHVLLACADNYASEKTMVSSVASCDEITYTAKLYDIKNLIVALCRHTDASKNYHANLKKYIASSPHKISRQYTCMTQENERRNMKKQDNLITMYENEYIIADELSKSIDPSRKKIIVDEVFNAEFKKMLQEY